MRHRTDTTQAARHHSFMSERHLRFVYLSVEAFRKLTPQQKQAYVQTLKDHLDVPMREVAADHSQSVEH